MAWLLLVAMPTTCKPTDSPCTTHHAAELAESAAAAHNTLHAGGMGVDAPQPTDLYYRLASKRGMESGLGEVGGGGKGGRAGQCWAGCCLCFETDRLSKQSWQAAPVCGCGLVGLLMFSPPWQA